MDPRPDPNAFYPSLAYSGVEGSGFASEPVDPARTTAKPALRLLTPQRQFFTDKLLIGFSAWANNEGSMLLNNGLSHVRVHYEGEVRDIAAPSLQTFPDANGNPVTYYGWWTEIARPLDRTGLARVYAEAVPSDETMQSRVMGPYVFGLSDEQHDFTADASNTAELKAAMLAARQAGADHGKITLTATGTYSIDGATSGGAYAGEGYLTITHAPGVTPTIGYAEGETGIMRSFYDRLHFKGDGIIIDMESIEALQSEALGQHWLDGCVMRHTNGNQMLWNGTTRNAAFAVRGSPWFTEVSFEGVYAATANANLVRGCVANNCYGDFCAQPKCVVGARVADHDSDFFRTYIDAMTLAYSGAGVATLTAVDSTDEPAGARYRRFTFEVDSVSVATYDSLTDNWQFNSGRYWVSDLVDFINTEPALADWSATLLDDTRQAGHLGVAGGLGSTFSFEAVTATPKAFRTFIDLHTDFSQFSQSAGAENVIIEGNEVPNFGGQLIWVSSNGALNDIFYINNIFNEKDGAGGLSQIGRTGAKSHLVLAHNTLTQQGLVLRDADLGAYSLIANNVMPGFTSDGPSIGPAIVADNHVYAGASAIAGSTGTVVAGNEASLFVDASGEDFTPAGELLSNLKAPVVDFDREGTQRAASAPVGAG